MDVCVEPGSVYFLTRENATPNWKARVCFPLNRVRSNFGKECVSLDTSYTGGYSLPRRDRLNQFQLPLYTLTRFRGRISKVCKATDLDFHGNLEALRFPPILHRPTLYTTRPLLTFHFFSNKQTAIDLPFIAVFSYFLSTDECCGSIVRFTLNAKSLHTRVRRIMRLENR